MVVGSGSCNAETSASAGLFATVSHSALVRLKTHTLTTVLLFIAGSIGAAHSQTRWIGSWATSQQVPEPQNALPSDDLRDATLRQLVHLSIGGTKLRVHISQPFCTAPPHFRSVPLSVPRSPP